MRVMLDTNVLLSALLFPSRKMDTLLTVISMHHTLVLSSAIVEGADILITGDKDFAGIEIDRPEILTPAEFLEQY